MDVTLDYNARIADVKQTIHYPNNSPDSLNLLTLAVPPNRWKDGFILNELKINGESWQAYEISGRRILLELPFSLAPASEVEISLEYRLYIPYKSRDALYGYNERQINLIDWYPFVVPYTPGSGWILPPTWDLGEHLVYPLADFEVHLNFIGEPPVVAASGQAIRDENGTRYILQNGRSFALSVSPNFQVQEITLNGVTILSYHHAPYQAAGEAVLQTTARSLQLYSDLFGAYPHETMTAVEDTYGDGMEYSAFYFLPTDFYALYDGTPKNNLVALAAHETVHQWWYERVGSDPALEPWLDEALATYGEYLFYEKLYPQHAAWWWDFRVNFFAPTGYVDLGIYDYTQFRTYVNATYLRGARFLHKLRARVGDEAFFAFLKEYTARYDGEIATRRDFFATLNQFTEVDYSDLLLDYFYTP
jgi:hypothetical protein